MNLPYLDRTDIKLDATMQELHDAACARVERQFERDGKLDPPFYVVNDGIHWIWTNTPYASNDERYMTVVVIRDMLAETVAVAYSQASEALHRRLNFEGGELGDDDIAFVVTIDRDGTFLTTRWQVMTVANGLNRLGPRQDTKADPALTRIAGEMFDLFGGRRNAAAAR